MAGRCWCRLSMQSARRWIWKRERLRFSCQRDCWNCKRAPLMHGRRAGAGWMRFHIVTIFPEFFSGPFGYGVVARAKLSGLLEIQVHDLRDWTYDRHRTVDDRPFGGGEGMLMKPEPVFAAVESVLPERGPGQKVVLLSAQGKRFDQAMAREFSRLEDLLLICGRYEGVDERVAAHLADYELSVGDFVLSGGGLGAAVDVG